MTHYDVADAIPNWGVWGTLRHVIEGPVKGHRNRGIDVTLPPYNAAGDGVTDDTAALQDALDDGLPIYLPAGKTFLASLSGTPNTAISVPSGARIYGEGTIKLANSQGNFVRLLVPADGASDIVIDGITLDGNKANQGTGEQRHLLFLDGVSDVEVRNVRFKDSSADAVYVVDSSDIRLKNSRISGSGRNGVTLSQGADEVDIDGCRIWDIFAQPIDSEPDTTPSPTNIRIADSTIEASTNYAIAAAGISAAAPTSGWQIIDNRITGLVQVLRAEDVLIEGNRITGTANSGGGGCVNGTRHLKDIAVVDNIIEGSPSATTTDGLVGFSFNTDLITGVKIEGNTIRSNGGGHPIKAFGVDDLSIVGNRLEHLATNDRYLIWLRDTAAVTNTTIEGNIVVGFGTMTNPLVYFHGAGSGFTNVHIGGNIFSATAPAAVEFVSGGTYTNVKIAPNVYGSGLTADITNDPRSAYSPSNVTTDRTFDADTVAVAELADVVGTLISDLQTLGVLA